MLFFTTEIFNNDSSFWILVRSFDFFSLSMAVRTGVTTLTNAVSGQSQNCSGNLEISP